MKLAVARIAPVLGEVQAISTAATDQRLRAAIDGAGDAASSSVS
ncbi:MAG: hypothetical protein ACR2KP_19310 [Egibacteraceae bacterium]|jgi:hypothetical protein